MKAFFKRLAEIFVALFYMIIAYITIGVIVTITFAFIYILRFLAEFLGA